MLNLKKTMLAVFALGSSGAFAGTMGPVCTPGNVTVPCETSAWDFGAYALYLKPSYDAEYTYGPFTSSDGITSHFLDIYSDWGWGFKLEGSYHFSTGNDLNLNWSHWQKDTEDSWNNVFFSGPISIGPINASTLLEPRWDAVNFEFGQHVDFGNFKDIRFHAGVQYARIEYIFNVSGFIAGATPTAVSTSLETKFDGIGPRVGADYQYNFGNGFAIYGNGAAALLVSDTNFNEVIAFGGVNFSDTSGSKTTIVPELEAKLGAKYTYSLAQGDVTLDAGWMFADYINALHCIGPLLGTRESSFGIQGPYAGLKWIGYA